MRVFQFKIGHRNLQKNWIKYRFIARERACVDFFFLSFVVIVFSSFTYQYKNDGIVNV